MLDYEVNKGISQTILSIKLGEVKPFDEFRYRMVKENTIQGILPVDRKIENAIVVYDYNITGVQSMERKYQGKKFSYQDVRQIYTGILQILLRSEEYFLDMNNFIITTQFVCYREEMAQFFLLYCPEYQKDSKEQMAELTEKIMNRVDYGDKPAVEMVYELFKMLRDDHTTLKEVLGFAQTGRTKQQPVIPQNRPEPEAFVYQNPMPQPASYKREPPVYNKPEPEKEKNKPKTEEQTGVSVKNIVLCGVVLVAGLAIFAVCYLSGFLYVENGSKLDSSKLAGVVVILGAVIFYACYKINETGSLKKDNQEQTDRKPKKEKKKKKESKNAQQNSTLTMPADWDWRAARQEPQRPTDKPVWEQNVAEKPAQPAFSEADRRVFQQPVSQPQFPQAGVQRTPLVPMAAQQQEAAYEPPVPEQKREPVRYCLVDQKGQSRQQFIIYKSPYLIGKSVEQVDGVIYSDAVSKVHAEFVIEDNNLYIIDMSSTNGTYVNKRKLARNQKMKIQNGDLITIADRQYKLIS